MNDHDFMTLLALGINHRTAAIDMRERVAFSPAQLEAALTQLRALPDVREAAVLSTCNRTELYCITVADGESQLIEWLSEFHGMAAQELLGCAYHYHDGEAARHLMRVAAGLDSMVLGEPQILGQLKDAYQIARQHTGLGSELERLFQQTFSVAKKVRSETSIGENPVSVAYAAVSLASRIFDDFSRARALLIGAGETIDLVARHLREAGIMGLTVANRTLARAQALAETCDARAIELGGIPQALEQADIVIASTASDLPILGKGMVERALKVRRHRPMFMVDIAVPRDIEPEVGDLDDVFLYSVDDLQQVIAENRRHREVAARQAESLIDSGVEHWLHERRVRGAGDLIRRYRQHGESLRRESEEEALAQLARGEDPEAVIKRLSHQLANKLMHGPTLRLREASGQSRQDIIQAADSLLLESPTTTQDAL
ncbi:glutamyl-tRNA reductase [Salinicola rhizosphaerae]|uniref:Glutamyl-tRNA reductase n=2 Tax=Salinicola rhizosphaerae TaxID=1443141 RepID=A0ABQ3DWW0_9GAMM|nr:glutamyl-tRNA reductase [Salinicola rhizosphaerae]